MGANAQTAVPVFTAGQVLTAAQVTQINTGIPVFATTVTRDAAFGGAGEKTLAEGQFAFIETGDITQFYNGTSWISLSSGLQVVLAPTAFTSQTTVSMATSTFTSTYTNYIVFLNVNSTASGSASTSIRVNNAGTPRATNGYYGGAGGYTSAGTTVGYASNNAAQFRIGDQSTTTVQAFQINVYNPTSATIKTTMSVNGFSYSDTVVNAQAIGGGCIYFNAAEANDGLTFIFANACTGSYAVYGVTA
jgi:hypothetical protein